MPDRETECAFCMGVGVRLFRIDGVDLCPHCDGTGQVTKKAAYDKKEPKNADRP